VNFSPTARWIGSVQPELTEDEAADQPAVRERLQQVRFDVTAAEWVKDRETAE